MTRQIVNWKHDELTRQGVEYLQQYWDLILHHAHMHELEAEFERGVLAGEMNEFHRRCLDNDKPGRRHMMPFYWMKARSVDGTVTEMKVPIKFGTPRYERIMADYKARMAELKKRTPNYGRKIQHVAQENPR